MQFGPLTAMSTESSSARSSRSSAWENPAATVIADGQPICSSCDTVPASVRAGTQTTATSMWSGRSAIDGTVFTPSTTAALGCTTVTAPW